MGDSVSNGLSFDVEEWFHILDLPQSPSPESWDGLPKTVERNTQRLLEILQENGTQATFFVLGWVARRYPELVRSIFAAGHEVASHGDMHCLVYEQGETAFEEDLRRARGTLGDLTGVAPAGYRAPGFSIGSGTPWAFEAIARTGFEYDSSLFPAHRGHGGDPGGERQPHRISLASGRHLLEFPMSVVSFGPLRIPFSGGGYLRLFPYAFLRWATRRTNAEHTPVCGYLHPREIDPGHPRLSMPLQRRFKSYVGLATTESKLRCWLRDFEFLPLADVLRARRF